MGAQTKLRYIAVHLPDGMREFISSRAKEKGYIVVADYLRDLLEEDLAKDGIEVSLQVRGGVKSKGA